MHLKRVLLIILFALLMHCNVLAAANNVYVSDSFEITASTNKHLFFLWSKAELLQKHSADILLFFSECEVHGFIDGNIYSLFSDVKIADGGIITGSIYSFSSVIGARLILSLCTIILAFLFMAIKRSFFEQGSVLLFHEPFRVITNGITFYFIILAAGLVFLLSVVGFIVTIFLLALLVLFIIAGQASISIMFGHIFADKLSTGVSIYFDLFIGMIFIESVKLIPYIGWTFEFLILPIFAIGLMVTNFANGFIKKVFYITIYDQFNESRDSAQITGEQILKMQNKL